MNNDKFAARRRGAKKARLIDAFNNRRNNENAFYAEIMNFAKSKMYHLETEFPKIGTVNTVDDFVQEVCLRVLVGLKNFKGDANSFYAWLHRICYTQASEFFNEIVEQRKTKAPLTVQLRNTGSGDIRELDNAEIYTNDAPERYIQIPEWITGDDRYICKLIMDGKTYEEIGEYVGISGNAVEHRVRKLRRTAEKIREHEKEEPAHRGRVRVG